MLDVAQETPYKGIDALKHRLTAVRQEYAGSDPGLITELVRAVLTKVSDDLTTKEATLLRAVEELGQTIATAKSEIAALRVDDITDHDIPLATDEIDAIVEHTAHATHTILESCEIIDEVSTSVAGEHAAKLQTAVTGIYEACSFQDITGQRITRVVTTLKMIEVKVAHIIGTFGPATRAVRRTVGATAGTAADLLNGPQLPTDAMDQSDIDKLLASFE